MEVSLQKSLTWSAGVKELMAQSENELWTSSNDSRRNKKLIKVTTASGNG